MSRYFDFITLILLAAALTVLFWLPLWSGGGFVGGDVYSYFLPQKVYFAERIAAGEFPLWNNRAGHGYPLVGESQTGGFYPLYGVFYTTLDVNSAYNAVHILHYVLAFVFAVLAARRFGLQFIPGLFAGLIYTYGWFPARSCVEWAIVGGAWFPAALWTAESFLQTGRRRWVFALAGVLTLQMLAGHFEIAFITQLVLIPYVAWRVAFAANDLSCWDGRRWRAFGLACAAIGFSFALAAVQLLPTWELKQHSQRQETGAHHELSFGSIPAWYWSQAVWPARWYSPLVNRNAALQESPPFRDARTNEVEAHLYFGVIPLVFAVATIVSTVRSRDRRNLVWILLGAAALFYTAGWFLPLTEHLPGFRYFQGPGRFGIITTFAVAVLAAQFLQRLLTSGEMTKSLGGVTIIAALWSLVNQTFLVDDAHFNLRENGIPTPLTLGGWELTPAPMMVGLVAALLGLVVAIFFVSRVRGLPSRHPGHIALVLLLFAATSSDLWIVSRLVTFSPMVSDPPIDHLESSPVRAILNKANEERIVRLFAPGANLPTVLGVAATPVYLTFGPAAYVDSRLIMPEAEPVDDDDSRQSLSEAQLDWMRRAGVTHMLSFQPLEADRSVVTPIWQGDDPLLNRAWARSGQPLYLYALNATPGRVSWQSGVAGAWARITSYRANRVAIEAESPIDNRLVLTDLAYPGWDVSIDGAPAASRLFEGMYRAVDVPAGRHTIVWTYRPAPLYWGACISGAVLLFLSVVACVGVWPFRSFAKAHGAKGTPASARDARVSG